MNQKMNDSSMMSSNKCKYCINRISKNELVPNEFHSTTYES